MKKIVLGFFIFIINVGFFAYSPKESFANPKCITFKVKVSAKNYPGGTLQVGCPGDRGPQCTGEIKNIKVGASKAVVLGKCSCYPNDNGCLTLGKKLKMGELVKGKRKVTVVTPIPSKCEITNKHKICGGNGDIISGTFRLRCDKPKPSPSVSPSVSPSPSVCPIPEVVPNVRVSCPDCFSQQDLDDAKKEVNE